MGRHIINKSYHTMREFDNHTLIEYHVKTEMDYQLEEIQKAPAKESFQNDSCCHMNQEDLSTQEFSAGEMSQQHSDPLESKPTEETPKKINGTPKLPKRKTIFKINQLSYMEHFDDSNSSEEARKTVRHRRKRGEAPGYPTKNFLPNAKGPHIKYLEDNLGVDYVNSFQIIKLIKSKDGISMKDYEVMYRTKEFEETFNVFFDQKVLYRELMISRSSLRARIIHMQKLDVFERAFRGKVFDRIN